MFGQPSRFKSPVIAQPSAALAAHPAVRAASEKHAAAARKLRTQLERCDSYRSRIVEIDAERRAGAGALYEGDAAAMRRDRDLAAERADVESTLASTLLAIRTVGEVAVAAAASEYATATRSAADELAADLRKRADDLTSRARELREDADAAGRALGQLRFAASNVEQIAKDGVTVRVRGKPSAVREQVLTPPAGASWSTSRLLEVLAPYAKLEALGDDLEVELSDFAAATPKCTASFRAVCGDRLSEDLRAALGTAVVAARIERRGALAEINHDNGMLREDAARKNAYADKMNARLTKPASNVN
jgi:hypothetical protein